MQKSFVVAAVLGGFLVQAVQAQQKPFSVDDLVRLDRVSEPQVSPDGRYVAFTVNETDMDANKRRADLWLLDFDSEKVEPRRLTRDPGNDTSPRWSPDSKTLYFLSNRSESSRKTAMPRTLFPFASSGGEKMPIPNRPGTTPKMPPDTPLLAGMPTRYAHSPAKSYMPQESMMLKTYFTSGWAIARCPEVGFTPPPASVAPIRARSRASTSTEHC